MITPSIVNARSNRRKAEMEESIVLLSEAGIEYKILNGGPFVYKIGFVTLNESQSLYDTVMQLGVEKGTEIWRQKHRPNGENFVSIY